MFPERHNQGKAGHFLNNNSAVSDIRQRRGQNFLSKIVPQIENKLT